jgi:glyoxylate reductase
MKISKIPILFTGHFQCTPHIKHYEDKYDITYDDFLGPDGHEKLLKTVQNAHYQAIYVHNHENINKEIIDAAKDLKVVSRGGVGYNSVDAAYCAQRGIWVCNTPGVIGNATADVALGHLLSIARRMGEAERWLRSGEFKKGYKSFIANDPAGKQLGIIGLGSIGKNIALKAKGIKMKVCYHNRNRLSPEEEALYSVTYLSKEELITTSDYISINVPLTPETKYLLNYDEFKKMKDGVFIINTSRGATINEQALVDALKSGKVKGAGLDVFENEPVVHPDLLTFPNVSLTPHIGSDTEETTRAIEELAFENIDAVLKCKIKPHTVR